MNASLIYIMMYSSVHGSWDRISFLASEIRVLSDKSVKL